MTAAEKIGFDSDAGETVAAQAQVGEGVAVA